LFDGIEILTSTFDVMKSNPAIGRAEALRRAMLAYMNDGRPLSAAADAVMPSTRECESGSGSGSGTALSCRLLFAASYIQIIEIA
jgi:hypothetical protein